MPEEESLADDGVITVTRATAEQTTAVVGFCDALDREDVDVRSIELRSDRVVELAYAPCDDHDDDAVWSEVAYIAAGYAAITVGTGLGSLEAAVVFQGEEYARWHVDEDWSGALAAQRWDDREFLEHVRSTVEQEAP